MKTKGGVINIYSEAEPDVTPAEAFNHFLTNSNIFLRRSFSDIKT